MRDSRGTSDRGCPMSGGLMRLIHISAWSSALQSLARKRGWWSKAEGTTLKNQHPALQSSAWKSSRCGDTRCARDNIQPICDVDLADLITPAFQRHRGRTFALVGPAHGQLCSNFFTISYPGSLLLDCSDKTRQRCARSFGGDGDESTFSGKAIALRFLAWKSR